MAGVSFHVGSSANNLAVYRGAVQATRVAFHAVAALGMPPMRVLDIGGMLVSGPTFDEAAAVINDALAQHVGQQIGEVLLRDWERYRETERREGGANRRR